jgi:hypothetical protein
MQTTVRNWHDIIKIVICKILYVGVNFTEFIERW